MPFQWKQPHSAEYLYICRWFSSQIFPEPWKRCLWQLALVLSCLLSSHWLLLAFGPSADSYQGAELGVIRFSPSPLTQKSLSEGLAQKWMTYYRFSTDPLVESQVTSQKAAGVFYPGLPRMTGIRLGDSKGQEPELLYYENWLCMRIRSVLCSVGTRLAPIPWSHYLVPKTYQTLLQFLETLLRNSFRAHLYLSWWSDFPDPHFISVRPYLSLPAQ